MEDIRQIQGKEATVSTCVGEGLRCSRGPEFTGYGLWSQEYEYHILNFGLEWAAFRGYAAPMLAVDGPRVPGAWRVPCGSSLDIGCGVGPNAAVDRRQPEGLRLPDLSEIRPFAGSRAPRRLVIAGGVTGAGHPLEPDALEAAFAFTSHVYTVLDATDRFRPVPEVDPARLAERIW